jgi:Raf kinase inhibitor-like YbhB/YbcL family protein
VAHPTVVVAAAIQRPGYPPSDRFIHPTIDSLIIGTPATAAPEVHGESLKIAKDAKERRAKGAKKAFRGRMLGMTRQMMAVIFFFTVLVGMGAAGHRPAAAQASQAAGGAAMAMTITTTAFATGGEIPKKYTCDGPDVSPALAWSELPANTKGLALIADDPDAPAGTWTHWVVWDIPLKSMGLAENMLKAKTLPDGTRQGTTDFRKVGYGGPCPPPGKAHRYFFKLYALDTKIDLPAGALRQELEEAMKGHVLAHAEVMGTYGR